MRRLIIISLCLLTAGCYRTSYKVALDQGNTYQSRHWNHYFVFGFVPVKENYNTNELCPIGSLLKFESKMDGSNLLSQIFSIGLNGARTLNAQCLAKSEVKK